MHERAHYVSALNNSRSLSVYACLKWDLVALAVDGKEINAILSLSCSLSQMKQANKQLLQCAP